MYWTYIMREHDYDPKYRLLDLWITTYKFNTTTCFGRTWYVTVAPETCLAKESLRRYRFFFSWDYDFIITRRHSATYSMTHNVPESYWNTQTSPCWTVYRRGVDNLQISLVFNYQNGTGGNRRTVIQFKGNLDHACFYNWATHSRMGRYS